MTAERTRVTGAMRALLWACIALTILLGLGKTWTQHERMPAWADKPDNRYEGYVAIDGHAHRAGALLAWLRGEPGSAALVRHWFAEDPGHPTTILPPALVAITALAVGSVPRGFLVVNALALIACCVLLRRLAERVAGATRLRESAGVIGWLAAIGFTAHCLTVRTAVQLHVDHLAAAAALLVADAGLAWALEGRGRHVAALLLGGVAGVFCKWSFLPALVAPPAAVLCLGGPSWRWLLLASACSAAPVPCVSLWVALVSAPGSATGDFAQHFAAWRLDRIQLASFGVEMALLFQVLPWLWSWASFRAERALLWCALVTGTALLASWSFRLPATPRLYVVPEAFAILLAAYGAIARWGWGRATRLATVCWCAANYALAAVANLWLARG